MNNDKDTLPALLAPRQMPDPKVLLADLRDSVTNASWYQQQMRENEDLRVCWWPGQSKDGRKHGTPSAPARPFENAADHRVHLIQELMNERTAVRMKAVKSAKITIRGRSMDDQKKAALLVANVQRHHEALHLDGLAIQRSDDLRERRHHLAIPLDQFYLTESTPGSEPRFFGQELRRRHQSPVCRHGSHCVCWRRGE